MNNLLMAIWGNLTLLRLRMPSDSPARLRVLQMEAFLQNTAFLLHLIYGFFAERRTADRQFRLDQMGRELTTLTYMGSTINIWNLWRELKSLGGRISTGQVAGITAAVADDLLRNIAAECRKLECRQQAEVQRISKINQLVHKGYYTTRRLHHLGVGSAVRGKTSVSGELPAAELPQSASLPKIPAAVVAAPLG